MDDIQSIGWNGYFGCYKENNQPRRPPYGVYAMVVQNLTKNIEDEKNIDNSFRSSNFL